MAAKKTTRTRRKSKVTESAEQIEKDPAIDNIKVFDMIIVEPILSIGIAFAANNYTTFQKRTVNGEEIHIPIGYYGKNLDSALKGMSREILTKRVTRKAKDSAIPLDELKDLIVKHNGEFDKLSIEAKKR